MRMRWDSASLAGRRSSKLAAVVSLAALSGCASVHSVRVDDKNAADGLLYFLPKRDIEISVTVPATGAPTIAVQATAAMPDVEHAFVAQVPRSAIGNVKNTVQVNAQGLLNSDSSSQITSSLTAVLQGAAGLAGGLRPFSELPSSPAAGQPCPTGTHSVIVRMQSQDGVWIDPGQIDLCDIKFTIRQPDAAGTLARIPKKTPQEPPPGESRAGLFYRIAVPYVVRAEGSAPAGVAPPVREFLVFSPTGSRTYFLPVANAAFGSNDALFAFDNGVPTKYGQTIQSELVGLVGLPATLLQSYFKAIGEMFGARKGSIEGEKQYLDAVNALALAQQKNQACASAVAANDSARIAADCK